MNIIGAGNLSLRKTEIVEGSRNALNVGYKKIAFAHQASAGQTEIFLSNLNFPASLASTLVANPSPQTLSSANLSYFYRNMTLISTSRGVLIPDISFTANNNSIVFIGFSAFENEIFYGIIDYVSSPNTLFVDARPLNVSRTLGSTQTTFNIGEAFKVNAYPSESSGAVKVFVNGVLKFRNTNNSNVNKDRDYYEIPTSEGLGTTIEFNNPYGLPVEVTVISNYAYIDRPENHLLQKFDLLASQLQSIASQGGFSIDVSQFPNIMDLKAFGDRMLVAENAAKTSGKIGDVVSSRLNLTQFRSERDNSWVACNGANYPGSDLANLIGVTTVPNIASDARGTYYIKINRI